MHLVLADDDALLRNFEDRFHHVQTRPDSVDDRYQKSKAGLEGTDIATESLDRPFVSLRHRFDSRPDKDYGEHDDQNDEDGNQTPRESALESKPSA